MMKEFKELKNLFENATYTGELFEATDGRLASALSEDSVYEWAEGVLDGSDFTVGEQPPIRYWYDMVIKKGDKMFPINIKITGGRTADNVSSKEGLFYALTGLDPKKSSINTWEKYINAITANLNPDSETDYYFLVVFKETNEILFTSLKNIQTLTPNGNNLPFQCNWGKNKTMTTRDEKTQVKYLQKVFLQSYIKRAPGLEYLMSQWGNLLDSE